MNTLVRVLFSSLFIQMKQSLARPTFKFIIFIQPFLYSLLFFFIFKNSSNSNIGEYIIVGTGLINLWSSIIFSSAGDIERERYMGTLEPISVTSTNFLIIFLGKVLSNVILGIFSMLFSLIYVVYVFSVEVQIKHIYFFFISFLITVVCFSVISILVASIFTLSRNSRLLMNSTEYPIYILCGVIFPVSILPDFLQYISYILAPTWAVSILRSSMIGINSLDGFLLEILILVSLTIVYLLIAIYLFKLINYRTRVKGSLGAH